MSKKMAGEDRDAGEMRELMAKYVGKDDCRREIYVFKQGQNNWGE